MVVIVLEGGSGLGYVVVSFEGHVGLRDGGDYV